MKDTARGESDDAGRRWRLAEAVARTEADLDADTANATERGANVSGSRQLMHPPSGLHDNDADWNFVSKRAPCSICGSDEGCRRALLGQFACCTRVVSQWPLSVGGWIHDIDREGAAPAVVLAHDNTTGEFEVLPRIIG